MKHITIDNHLYKVTDKDAKYIDSIPLSNPDELDIKLTEMTEKYKPVQCNIKIYNIS